MRTTLCAWSFTLLFAPQPAAQAPQSAYYWFTLDEQTISRIVPSYAGRWFGGNNEIHASVVNLKDSSVLRSLFDAREPIGFAGKTSSRVKKTLVIERAKYSHLQLDNWRARIAQKAVGAHDFGAIGIRAKENRVRVVVDKPQTIPGIRRMVESLAVPDDAFVIVVLGKPVYR